jgi:SAM-dependent methyltransferase
MHAGLGGHKADWDQLGEFDPLWAILSDPAKKYGRWDETAFFQTGEDEIASVLASASSLGYPRAFGRALDFGCGVGRLARALAGRFAEVKGVDVSESMIRRARELNAHLRNCAFLVNDRPDLALFPDGHFDFGYSNIVLQHLPSRGMIYAYVGEFIRTLAPGGLLVFQLPSRLPLLVRLQPRRTLFSLLRALGVSQRTLYWKLGLHPIRMRRIGRPAMEAFLARHGRILHVETTRDPYFPVESSVYFVTRS